MEKPVKCIKAVPYQDILDVKEVLERMQSWGKSLLLLNDFFSDQNIPVNKKKIIRDYYACGKIYHSYFKEMENMLNILEKQICVLTEKQSIFIQQNTNKMKN
ncbi:hypothetical protein CI088_02515 [Enterococcus plantarum]|uniref:Uncharacterized protein n=1 Tax=Enterococcus plantarum TaxID=1077675 RepID=A0A2W4BI67_9ENTE|nr:hypothetical protein [Enterococcus plantarum]PZL76675.1 hypothetical protein CI088_02515 [Enterococcus plantarum]